MVTESAPCSQEGWLSRSGITVPDGVVGLTDAGFSRLPLAQSPFPPAGVLFHNQLAPRGKGGPTTPDTEVVADSAEGSEETLDVLR